MELKEVTYVLNDDYLSYMKKYLKQIVDPEAHVTEGSIDATADELDIYLTSMNIGHPCNPIFSL